MNSCQVDKVVYDITVGGIFSGVVANVVCYALGLTFFLGLGCVAATAIFAGYFGKLVADLQYNVKSCGWVWHDTNWNGWFNVYPAC